MLIEDNSAKLDAATYDDLSALDSYVADTEVLSSLATELQSIAADRAKARGVDDLDTLRAQVEAESVRASVNYRGMLAARCQARILREKLAAVQGPDPTPSAPPTGE